MGSYIICSSCSLSLPIDYSSALWECARCGHINLFLKQDNEIDDWEQKFLEKEKFRSYMKAFEFFMYLCYLTSYAISDNEEENSYLRRYSVALEIEKSNLDILLKKDFT